MKTELSSLLTVNETAGVLRLGVKTVRRMICRGDIPAVKISNRWRVKLETLNELLGASNGD